MREADLHSGEVLDLLDQRAIPILTRPHFFLAPLAFGDVLNGEQDHVRLAVHRLEAAGVEQHVPTPESGEGVFNLDVFNGVAVAQDLGQQRPRLGDVPLAVAQVVDEAALVSSFETWKSR